MHEPRRKYFLKWQKVEEKQEISYSIITSDVESGWMKPINLHL